MDSRPGLGSTDPPTPVSMEPIEEPTRFKGESNGGEERTTGSRRKDREKGRDIGQRDSRWTEGKRRNTLAAPPSGMEEDPRLWPSWTLEWILLPIENSIRTNQNKAWMNASKAHAKWILADKSPGVERRCSSAPVAEPILGMAIGQ